MSDRKRLGSIIVLATVGLAAAAVLIYSRQPRPAGSGVLPYYQRTGFMSKLLLELNIGPKGLESIHVPDGFEVVAVAPGLVTYPMFFAFDDRGLLFVCESAVRNIGDQELDRQPEMRSACSKIRTVMAYSTAAGSSRTRSAWRWGRSGIAAVSTLQRRTFCGLPAQTAMASRTAAKCCSPAGRCAGFLKKAHRDGVSTRQA